MVDSQRERKVELGHALPALPGCPLKLEVLTRWYDLEDEAEGNDMALENTPSLQADIASGEKAKDICWSHNFDIQWIHYLEDLGPEREWNFSSFNSKVLVRRDEILYCGYRQRSW